MNPNPSFLSHPEGGNPHLTTSQIEALTNHEALKTPEKQASKSPEDAKVFPLTIENVRKFELLKK